MKLGKTLHRVLKISLPILLAVSPFFAVRIFAQGEAPPDSKPTASAAEPSEEVKACLGCHSKEADAGPAVNYAALQTSPHAAFECTMCHGSFTPEYPHTQAMRNDKAKCANCHDEPAKEWAGSVHARPDKVKGDHPTCATCHGGGDPHAVTIRGEWTRRQKVEVCSNCHRNKELMARYGPNTQAVEAYERSFHGKALIRFGNLKTAICWDCHRSHVVLMPTNADARTNPNHLKETCGQPDCHPGADQNFSVSGAGHMYLHIDKDPILRIVQLFFKVLVFGMASFLLMGVALDMRRSVFGDHPPKCGREVGLLVALGMLFMTAAIFQAVLELPAPMVSAGIGVGLLTLSLLLNKVRRQPKPATPPKQYKRLGLSLRIQHGLLALAFTILVVTGMPVREAQDSVMRDFYMFMGGMDVVRVVHRVGAVMMIGVFGFHILELIWKWSKAGFTLRSWTMLPTKKDVKDFVDVSKYYIGKAPEEPKYGRFQFREKLDYFAEYWGVPLMIFSGLVLWFPVQIGNHLPPLAISIAYIAHSWEAVLAFLAILTWHMYNTHFSPHHFPMNPAWWTGTLSEDAMRREHPLELEEMQAKEQPVPEPEPPAEPETPATE